MKYLIFLLIALTAHADTKISQLPLGSAASSQPADSFPYVNTTAGQTYRLDLADLPNLPAFQAFGLSLIPSQTGHSGSFLTTNGSVTSWGSPSGTGTVTSVGLTAPAFLSVSGSPVTTNGTIAITAPSQSANTFLGAPNGSSGTPSFRSLVGADLPSTVVQTNQANTYTASPQSLGTQVETVQLANDGSTGTALHKLAKFTSSGTAVIMSTSDTTGALGVVAFGAGTSGNSDVAMLGQTTCVFDGATTAGDYVEISSSVAGDCTDAGGSLPGSGQIVGRALSTNGSAGTYTVALFLPSVAGSGSGGGVSSVNASAPTGLSFSGGPITGAGTLALSWSGTIPNAQIPDPTTSALGGTESLTCSTHQWLNSISTSGVPACAQPSLSDLIGYSLSGNTTKLATSTGTLTSGDCVKIDANGNYVDAGAACGAGGGGTPGGSPSDVQYNSSGSFGGNSSFTYDGSGNATLSGKISSASANVSGLTASEPVVSDASDNLISGSVSAPLTYAAGVFGCQTASGSQAGCLSSSDWTTFNGKQAALSMSNGQVPIGTGSGYSAATLTAGSGISITNGSGSVTISQSSPSPSETAMDLGSISISGCSVAWTTTSSSYSDYSAQTGCSYSASSGSSLSAPSTNIPGFTLSGGAGTYLVVFSGAIGNYSGSGGQAAFQITDGTNTSVDQPYSIYVPVGYGVTGTATWTIREPSAFTGLTLRVQGKNIVNAEPVIYATSGVGAAYFTVYYFPAKAAVVNDWSGSVTCSSSSSFSGAWISAVGNISGGKCSITIANGKCSATPISAQATNSGASASATVLTASPTSSTNVDIYGSGSPSSFTANLDVHCAP